jgi:hypothetical protein
MSVCHVLQVSADVEGTRAEETAGHAHRGIEAGGLERIRGSLPEAMR